MDHAINNLRSYMESTLVLYAGFPKEDLKGEIKAYVDALNKLENYYYGEKKTSLDVVLSSHK